MRKRLIILITLAVVGALLLAGAVLAEDGLLFRRNISKTPDAETEMAAVYMMDFYVPAQSSAGLVGPINNYILDDDAETVAYAARDYAKPLISVYIDDVNAPIGTLQDGFVSIQGGMAYGHFDAFAGVSLDDGTSWKTTNLSNSGGESSFFLEDGTPSPGDVHHLVHQVAGAQIFVAWASRYCDSGTPLYKLDLAENADYFADLEETYGKNALYLYDLFGVKGTQGSVNYTEMGHPDVGEKPYSCIWTARGKLLPGDDPATTEIEATYVMWTKAERLTSGTRDANLPAVDCAIGAGCVLTWQEDPQGLRPGDGLGPGEGWSGAVANGKTDIWYSYISYADFDLVFAAEDTVGAITMADYALLEDARTPKPYVPMAMPIRLTDNAMCKGISSDKQPSDPYCYIDFDTIDDINHTNVADWLEGLDRPEPGSDFCAETVLWTTPGGATLPICKTEDGRVLNGRVASTRVRLNLKPYTPAGAIDADGDGIIERSAWVVMAAEETKALGDMLVDPYGNPAEDAIDIGKNVWYYSFDMFDHPIVDQGGMLNQPAICSPWTVGATYQCTPHEFFPVQIDPLNEGEFYLTEIARRFALTTNSVQAAMDSESGLSAMLIYKQGIINQGGPADIFLRRVVIPDTFDPTVDNPYAFENMECDEWAYTDGSNPNYLKGLCLSPAINISGSTIVECTGGTGNDTCASTFPVADDGSIPDNSTSFPKVTEWRQCDGIADIEGCEADNDLDDQSWESPFDVAKGHRGFLDGDYVMIMYAWSPNWKANSVGNDHYNLYVRRSFDGGLTWTTTPAHLGGTGVTATENFCVSTPSADCVGTEFTYAAGAFEQGRNVSQLIGNRITILDPRYSPTGGLKLYPTIRTDWLTANGFSFEGLPYDDDLARDPSKFFMIYETGDNTTVTEGEAVPLDLFYSRATVYGDVWELDPDYYNAETGEIEDYRWNWVEKDHDLLSGEASMLANPGGTFMYAVWNQWQEEITHWVDAYGIEHEEERIFNSDIWFRRFLYLPDDTTVEGTPVASILFANNTVFSIAADDMVVMVGSARDFGANAGIEEYGWWYKAPGSDPSSGGVRIGYDQKLELPAGQLPGRPGWAQIVFKARDKSDNWSPGVTVNVWVVQELHKSFMPMVTH